MPNRTPWRWLRAFSGTAAAVAAAMLLASCGGSGPAASPAPNAPTTAAPTTAAGSPAPGNQAPALAAGDIPDTTIYVPFRFTAGHVLVKVPEGWARSTTATSTTFTSSLNSITIASVPMKAAPTVSTARAVTVPALSQNTQGFKLQSVQAVNLSAGPAIEIIYQVNSQPDQVTGRTYRLVIERFELLRGGNGAVLSLSSAVGSDNVDPWRIVSESLQWL